MPPIMGEVLDLAYNDPAVGMIIVDRVISRNIFHLPDLPDPTPETIRVLNGKRHPKPTVFSVDSEGGDPDLARRGADPRGQFCRPESSRRAGSPSPLPRLPETSRHLMGDS
jgi:hypothetical protein